MSEDETYLGYADDDLIRHVLTQAKTIAIVGASPKPERPSWGVMQFLIAAGYRVIPVNLGHDGKKIAGELVYARLADIPEPIHMVDVFRRSDALPGLVDEILALEPRPTSIWTQFGVINNEATNRAKGAGLKVVVDRCSYVEYPRLL